MTMNERHGPHDHAAVAATFRALAEPVRLTIVHALSDGEARVTDLVARVGLAQSTTSAHLAVLREAGLVTARAEGRATYYRLATRALLTLVEHAESLLAEGLHAVVHSHEDAEGDHAEDDGAEAGGAARAASRGTGR